jgi:hypothetical protein
MRSIVAPFVLLLCAGAPQVASAQAPADEGPAPTPVTLPEDSQSTTPAPTAASAPPAPPPAPVAPAPVASPPPPFASPRVAAPSGTSADTGVERPKGPIHSRFNAAVNVDTVWYTGKSFDFFSERNNSTVPGLSVGYAVWMDAPLSLVPEIGWGTNTVSQDGLFGGAIGRTELLSHNAYGGLSLRYGILSFLEAHARVAGGASFIEASMSPGGAASRFEDSVVSPYGSLGAGVNLHSPAGVLETRSGGLRSVLAGLTFEGGYQLGGSVALTPKPADDPGRIPTTYMSLGSLERSGPYFRTSLVVRF